MNGTKKWWQSSIINIVIVAICVNWAAFLLDQCNWKIALANTLIGVATAIRRVQTTTIIEREKI